MPLEPALLLKAQELANRGWPKYDWILDRFHEAREDLKLDHRFTPHVLRHTVVTRLGKAKVPVTTIMELVGHRSVTTTKGYSHPDVETLAQATEALRSISKRVEQKAPEEETHGG